MDSYVRDVLDRLVEGQTELRVTVAGLAENVKDISELHERVTLLELHGKEGRQKLYEAVEAQRLVTDSKLTRCIVLTSTLSGGAVVIAGLIPIFVWLAGG